MYESEYSQYYNNEVRIILDTPSFDRNYHSFRASVALEIKATITGETEKSLNLENISILNIDKKGSFKKAIINKDYIVGIFSGEIQK
jgi:hypothetical protein